LPSPPPHTLCYGGGFGQIFLLLNIIKNTPALAGWPKQLTRKKVKSVKLYQQDTIKVILEINPINYQ